MDFSIFFYSSNSKPPIQTTTQTNLVQRSDKFRPNFHSIKFMPVSCRIHAGFMHLYTYAEFMSDSCRIQLNSVLPFIYIELRRFHAGFMHLYTYADFMSDSCRIQLSSVLPFIYIDLCCFHAGFMLFSIIVTSTCIHIKPDSVKFSISLHKHRMIIM